MHGDEFDPSGMVALVIDENAYSRRISIEQLRGMGFGRALGVATTADAWEVLLKENPNVVLVEWVAGGASLDFVRRVRMSDEAPDRATPIFMLTARGAQAEVEAAREAGFSGYMRKPISALLLSKHVRKAVAKPQPFIATATYVGPCRRRRAVTGFQGPWRRLDDVTPVSKVDGDEDVLDLKAEIARARVAALAAVIDQLIAGDANAARAVYKAVQALVDAAEQIGDACLVLGAKEMARYIQAQGATERLDPEVVRTHVAALHQLASLPHAMGEARDKVAQSLKRMIDKKLRPASAA
ncbi:MAG: response regulator [Terricaulis sp.]